MTHEQPRSFAQVLLSGVLLLLPSSMIPLLAAAGCIVSPQLLLFLFHPPFPSLFFSLIFLLTPWACSLSLGAFPFGVWVSRGALTRSPVTHYDLIRVRSGLSG
jgi:hypothetical protein